ncbi:unnamed protein product [Coffea canephora]|uniref:SAM domain-containing protein n=1 Tax=Coffea canephora TaxID=49390 RepID=A0A068TWB7_COFCA|nr:unnamed protein product [Coffea canephora]
MAETSRSRVTITLGRAGQVVKRAGPGVDDSSSFADSQHPVGAKRSVRDRLGSNVDSSSNFNNKRQRGDVSRLSRSASNDVDDVTLNKDDLRFKIMHKSSLNKGQSSRQLNGMDLRDLLSRPAQSSTSSLGTQQRMPQLKDPRKHFPEPRDGRHQMLQPRNARYLMPEPSDGRRHVSEPRDARQPLSESRDVRYVMPGPKDDRNLRLGSNSSSFPGQIRSSRTTDSLPHLDSLRNSYSPWTLDSLRQGGRVAGSSRGLTPSRRNEELEERPLVRAYNESRGSSYMSKEALEHSCPISSAPYVAKTAQTAAPAKSMAPPLASLPPSVTLSQRSSYTVEDQPTVDSFLHSLGLDKYAINFKAEEVDMYALKQMRDNDLKELGVPMGPRKKIIQALLARAKRQI